jgi:hypothetical protein
MIGVNTIGALHVGHPVHRVSYDAQCDTDGDSLFLTGEGHGTCAIRKAYVRPKASLTA